MYRVEYKEMGVPIRQWIEKLSEYQFEIQERIMEVGLQGHEYMVNFIKHNKKRPGGYGNLEKSITLDILKTTSGIEIGIGNKTVLNERAKYWTAINYGSSHIVGKRIPGGAFYPGNPMPDRSSFRQGRFISETGTFTAMTGTKSYSFVSKRPIPPMNYIENTNHYIINQINRYIMLKLQKI